MTLNSRHQRCHPEVNSVLRVFSRTLRGITKLGGGGDKKRRKCGSAGGKRSRADMQASGSLIVSSISVLPALVTSKACSHAAQCLPWIIETTLCPAQSSLLNSPPRHSDTLQPRRDSFTLAHRNTVCRGLWGHELSAGTNHGTGEREAAPPPRSANTTLWPGSRSVEPNPSIGFSFYRGEMLS